MLSSCHFQCHTLMTWDNFFKMLIGLNGFEMFFFSNSFAVQNMDINWSLCNISRLREKSSPQKLTMMEKFFPIYFGKHQSLKLIDSMIDWKYFPGTLGRYYHYQVLLDLGDLCHVILIVEAHISRIFCVIFERPYAPLTEENGIFC